MQNVTDWAGLWAELVDINAHRFQLSANEGDHWYKRAREYANGVKQRWSKPDSSRDFFLSKFEPGSTLLDIGAGTGAWTVLAAPLASRVTAVDPSPSMRKILHENLVAADIQNVDVIDGSWPDVEVGMYDYSLSSHSMYGVRDLPRFIRSMVQVTRRTCFLLMRVPVKDSVIQEACRHIWGHSIDSPNFIVAYNLLLDMGIQANVLMETPGAWKGWEHESLQDALADVKSRFGLTDCTDHDEFLLDLFKRRLKVENGRYLWQPSARSALIYWDV